MATFTSAAMRFWLVVLVVLGASGCDPPTPPAKIVLVGPLAEIAKTADRIVLWEGLPHQDAEPELLRAERAAKPTREWYGYPFYQALPHLDAESVEAIRRAFTEDVAPGLPAGYVKRCGFHPDYAVEFRRGDEVGIALVCFGCKDIRWYVGETYERFQIAGGADLSEVLTKHALSRPPRAR